MTLCRAREWEAHSIRCICRLRHIKSCVRSGPCTLYYPPITRNGRRTTRTIAGLYKYALPLLVGAVLCGCTASYISGEAISTNQAVEAETNSILVINILRARDGVPTYYSDISHLRGSLQTQASIQAPIGFGHYANWTGRSLISPGASVQTNPSFDVAPLNTQGFTEGINEPLDICVFECYLDRAIPPYTILELFVDKIEDVTYQNGKATITPYYNVPCDVPETDCGLRSAETGERYFDAKIRYWTQPYLFLHPYKLLSPYGPPFAIGRFGTDAPQMRDFSGVANAGLTLRPDGPASVNSALRTYRLYTVSNNIAFCVGAQNPISSNRGNLDVTVRSQDGSHETTRAYEVIRVAPNTVSSTSATVSESVDPSACVKDEVFATDKPSGVESESHTILHFRSVDGMIEFLGRMLRVPPRLRPLNFEISVDDPGTSRFDVSYQGQNYYVHNRRRRFAGRTGCGDGATDPMCEDRTLEILRLVNQLLNLNKSQNELPSTGAVQVVN